LDRVRSVLGDRYPAARVPRPIRAADDHLSELLRPGIARDFWKAGKELIAE
jgi:hypothetical protein